MDTRQPHEGCELQLADGYLLAFRHLFISCQGRALFVAYHFFGVILGRCVILQGLKALMSAFAPESGQIGSGRFVPLAP